MKSRINRSIRFLTHEEWQQFKENNEDFMNVYLIDQMFYDIDFFYLEITVLKVKNPALYKKILKIVKDYNQEVYLKLLSL